MMTFIILSDLANGGYVPDSLELQEEMLPLKRDNQWVTCQPRLWLASLARLIGKVTTQLHIQALGNSELETRNGVGNRRFRQVC
jgi:hypothetical protein